MKENKLVGFQFASIVRWRVIRVSNYSTTMLDQWHSFTFIHPKNSQWMQQ